MINSTSKNNSFICVEDVCDDRRMSREECDAHAERQASLRETLHQLWTNIRLFLGTDRWNGAITLQRGDSHYTMKMEDIEARWRNR